MKVLLDTHILLWWLEGDRRLRKADREHIADLANEIWVSAASAYEVALKATLGKIDWEVDALRVAIGLENFRILDLSWKHLALAGALPTKTNKDPWDRMLVAQAILEDMPLVTGDTNLKQLFAEAREQLGLS
jgi:PIN domain nuclease of toxin-antitoxin system